MLKKYLEQRLTFFVLDDGEIKINPKKIEPKNELYNYEMIDGINYIADISKPQEERIISMTYNGEEIKEDDTFSLCLTNYRASGTGGYDMVKDMKFVEELQVDFSDVLIDYLLDKKEIEVIDNNKIKLIK